MSIGRNQLRNARRNGNIRGKDGKIRDSYVTKASLTNQKRARTIITVLKPLQALKAWAADEIVPGYSFDVAKWLSRRGRGDAVARMASMVAGDLRRQAEQG